MSKAEDRALEKYPKKIEWVGNQWDGAPFDVNSESRAAYKQGYQQAEKDFADAENELKAIQVVGCKMKCEDCEFCHQNDPDYPDNCEYPDNPPCNG